MSSKILVSEEEYINRKKYLENKYNNSEYINKLINKKLSKLKVAEITNHNYGKLLEKADDDSGKKLIKNKSIGTKNWSIFRAKEYERYKNQMNKRDYTNFAKLAGYVWSQLTDEEKYDAVENGWGGDWTKVIIK